MDAFVVCFGLLLLAMILSLLAAVIRKDKQAESDDEPEDNNTVTDDLRLVQSCHELKQLAARSRKNIMNRW